jgi:hypothetical protein
MARARPVRWPAASARKSDRARAAGSFGPRFFVQRRLLLWSIDDNARFANRGGRVANVRATKKTHQWWVLQSSHRDLCAVGAISLAAVDGKLHSQYEYTISIGPIQDSS